MRRHYHPRSSGIGREKVGYFEGYLRPYVMLLFKYQWPNTGLQNLWATLVHRDGREELVEAVAPVPGRAKAQPWFRTKDDQAGFREDLMDDIDESGWTEALKGRYKRIANQRLYQKALFEAMRRILVKRTAPKKTGEIEERLALLAGQLFLTDGEKAVLMASYLEREIPSFRHSLEAFTGRSRVQYISDGSGVSVEEVSKALSPMGTIRRCHLIEGRDLENFLDISESLRQFLDTGDEKAFLAEYCHGGNGEILPLSQFKAPVMGLGECLETSAALLKSPGPSHLLFYGAPGVGKTQLVRALCADAGLSARFVNEEGSNDRFSCLEVAARLLRLGKEVLIIDEADRLLNSAVDPNWLHFGRDKGRLNGFLDSFSGKAIWITNDASTVPESVRRRFHFSWEFKGLDTAQRRHVWSNLLEGHPMEGALRHEIDALAVRFPVDIGGMKNALNTLGTLVGITEAPSIAVTKLGTLLERYHEFFRGAPSSPPLAFGEGTYDPTLIRTDLPIEPMVAATRGFDAKRHRGGLEGLQTPQGDNLNFLFWGPPGTGKTAFARHLARSCQREILVKRASDLQNMYVGQTEKLIRGAFLEAERSGAILLIDEADSFLGNRDGHVRSWETSFVNEFLTRMESHRGILICTTNLISRLDPASMRRFSWKVGFKAPGPEERLRMVQTYFPGMPLEGEWRNRVRELEGLNPGDVVAVHKMLQFTAPDQWDPALVVERLITEVGYRRQGETGKAIGFGR